MKTTTSLAVADTWQAKQRLQFSYWDIEHWTLRAAMRDGNQIKRVNTQKN
jgi:hypothetical protein